eukprot:TRINITY_DN63111_c0_g1_i1.p1 TRINITY_DN63111_c0_g1~~TRINITY_DN63111_c0_g1_i1.p1  ORF type:complete len:553 (+),score=90.95 TRINITY_DN63111_c0_g1_i1:184-1842(+)
MLPAAMPLSSGPGRPFVAGEKLQADEDGALFVKEKPRGETSIETLPQNFGHDFLFSMVAIRHLFLALVHHLVQPASGYVFRAHHVTGPHMQLFHAVTHFPAALEPLIGFVSDACPTSGYNKAPYMLLASLCGVPAFLAIGVLPDEALSAAWLALCLLLIKMQMSTLNVLSDAMCIVKLRGRTEQGPALYSALHLGALGFAFLGSALSGLLVGSFGPKSVYVAAAVPACFVMWPLARGWLGERRLSEDEANASRARMRERCGLTTLPSLVALGGLAFILTGALLRRSPVLSSLVALCIVAVLLYSYLALIDVAVGRVLIYSLIHQAATIQTSGASYYFYTDTWAQYPEGPHFSPFFYVSVMQTLSLLFGVFGTLYYARCMKAMPYRHVLTLTVLCGAACRVGDALLFSRLNVWLGLPDTFLVLGDQVIEPVLGAWRAMLMSVLMASLCPKGMEATVHGLHAGAVYIGSAAARIFGAALLHFYGCRPSGQPSESEQFEHLWKIALLSACLTLTTGLGCLKLIPDRVSPAFSGSSSLGADAGLPSASASNAEPEP